MDPDFQTLWFVQPDLGLPSKVRCSLDTRVLADIHKLQEYFAEKDIVELYQDTMSKILEALDETPEKLAQKSPEPSTDTEEKQKVWPPWPWPPWGDEDHDGHHGDGRQPTNKSQKARDLANDVFKFEKQIADASLDL